MDAHLRPYLNAVVVLLAAILASLLVLLPMVASRAPLPGRTSIFVAVLVVTVLVATPVFAYVSVAGGE